MAYANRMKNTSMTIVVLLASLVGGASAAGASDLPDCVGNLIRWNNCIGTCSHPDGRKYVGEWKYRTNKRPIEIKFPD